MEEPNLEISQDVDKHDDNNDNNDSAADTNVKSDNAADLVAEIQELEEALQQRWKKLEAIERQTQADKPDEVSKAAEASDGSEDKRTRKQFRRARSAQKWAQKVEEEYATTERPRPPTDFTKHLADIRNRAVETGNFYDGLISSDNRRKGENYDDIDRREHYAHQKSQHSMKKQMPPSSLRPGYSPKPGPPTQWGTSDGQEWDSDISTKSEDFHSFRGRLRADVECELDGLEAQKMRYKRHRAKKAKAKKDSEADTLKTEACIAARLCLLKWENFRLSRNTAPENSSVISILDGEPEPEIDYTYGYLGNKTEAKSMPPQFSVSSLEPDHYTGSEELPERIRINSRPIMKTLSIIRGSNVSRNVSRTSIIVRPFRILCHYEEELRRRYSELKERVAAAEMLGQGGKNEKSKQDDGDNSQPTKSNASTKVNDPDDYSTSPTGLAHLGVLIQFIDTYIVRKRTYLQSLSCQSIFFSDIWLLHNIGDILIDADKQAYRIISVTSASHKRGVINKETPRICKHYSAINQKEKEAPKGAIRITCLHVDFNGAQVGPVITFLDILRFEGKHAVTLFQMYPLRFYQGAGDPVAVASVQYDQADSETKVKLSNEVDSRVRELRASLIDRGRMFVRVLGIQQMYYSGLVVGTHDEIESPVIVDCEEAFVKSDCETWMPDITTLLGASVYFDKPPGPEIACTAECCAMEDVINDRYVEEERFDNCMHKILALFKANPQRLLPANVCPRLIYDIRARGDIFEEEDLLIMSYSVFGFVLKDRKWAQLDLAYLSDFSASRRKDYEESGDESAFERLVLDQKIKNMVLSLIAQHFRNKQSAKSADEQADIVRGKGKGLIILLHGAPGVGKTTTAEGVAERFNKPLFQITCGDLGSTAKEVEMNLSGCLSLANRWGCIMLLDEADVFLASRRREDFTRNGLVAVFLRLLEYYAGILFLTTNRIGDFDEAFASRIHMSLYYPPLDRLSTTKIFRLNFQVIEKRGLKSGRAVKIETDDIIEFVIDYWERNKHARWNGRQIRNACQTALALAEFEVLPAAERFDLQYQSATQVVLRRANIEAVSDAYLEFIEYVNAVKGTDQETYAKEIGIRAHQDKRGKKASKGKESSHDPDPFCSFSLPPLSHHPTHSLGTPGGGPGHFPQYGGGGGGPTQPRQDYRQASPSPGTAHASMHGQQPGLAPASMYMGPNQNAYLQAGIPQGMFYPQQQGQGTSAHFHHNQGPPVDSQHPGWAPVTEGPPGAAPGVGLASIPVTYARPEAQ